MKPIASVLDAARDTGMLVVHTREGHLPDLSDAPPAKVERGAPSLRIGDPGPMGRILIRGEAGHDIIPELYPLDSEIVIDKPGKGAFYATELGDVLQNYGIENLLVCGVTTEVCVNTTVREANDRGYRCVVLADGCASYFPEFHEMGLKMIKAQGGIFGWVSELGRGAARHFHRRFQERQQRGHHDEHEHDGDCRHIRLSSRHCGRRATGTPCSASAPTSSSTCWC